MYFSPLNSGEAAWTHSTTRLEREQGGEKKRGERLVGGGLCVCVCARVWKWEAGRRNEKHFWWRMFTLKSACDITVRISINVSSHIHLQWAEGSRPLNAPHHRTGQRDGPSSISNSSPNGETTWWLCVCCGSAAVRSDTGMAHPHVESDWNNMMMYYLYSSCQILSISRSQPRCDHHFF